MLRPKRITITGCGFVFSLLISTAAAEVVVVVSAESPVTALTEMELSDIFLGKTNRFPNGESVIPVNQAESQSAYKEFYKDYLGRSAAQLKTHWSRLIFTGRGRPPESVANDSAAADFIAGNPNAIGYIAPKLVDDRLRVVSIE